MDKFLETYNLPKPNQEEAENLNRQMTPSGIERIIKNLPAHKSPGAGASQENFTCAVLKRTSVAIRTVKTTLVRSQTEMTNVLLKTEEKVILVIKCQKP